MEVGNMEDINNMSIHEFNGILFYLDNREKKHKGSVVPLKDSQKEMIKRAKEKK